MNEGSMRQAYPQFALATLVGKTTSPLVAAQMAAVKASPAVTGTPRFGAFARLGSPMTP